MELVQFSTNDKLRLNGLLCRAQADTTVIHVHGKCGNFYENKFVKIMMNEYPKAGLNFLSFNNRGTACYTEAIRGEQTIYIGTSIEEISDCVYDLSAAIQFARTFSSRIVLQGHSFGCEKLMYFAQSFDPRVELILLSPSDGYRLQEVFISPETVESQLNRLRARYKLTGMEWLPSTEYGINGPGLHYHVPITAKALVGLITGPAFELLRLSKGWSKPKIPNRSLVYLGTKDALQVDGIDAMVIGISERFSDSKCLIYPDGRHDLGPNQEEVISKIVEWIKR